METYLTGEHEQLQTLLEGLRALVGQGAWKQADAGFADYADGIERVLRFEEDVVLPTVQKHYGKLKGIERLHREHMLWREAVDVMADGLAARVPARFEAGFAAMAAVVAEHQPYEERTVYPLLDRALASHEREDFARRLGAP